MQKLLKSFESLFRKRLHNHNGFDKCPEFVRRFLNFDFPYLFCDYFFWFSNTVLYLNTLVKNTDFYLYLISAILYDWSSGQIHNNRLLIVYHFCCAEIFNFPSRIWYHYFFFSKMNKLKLYIPNCKLNFKYNLRAIILYFIYNFFINRELSFNFHNCIFLWKYRIHSWYL